MNSGSRFLYAVSCIALWMAGVVVLAGGHEQKISTERLIGGILFFLTALACLYPVAREFYEDYKEKKAREAARKAELSKK